MKTIDQAKRDRVMQRSQELGHCICDVRRSCPCDIFIEQDLCPCAGERPAPIPVAEVQLTRYARNAGCASKIAPADLEAVLKRLPPVNDPAVLSGLAAADDAAIYRIADGVCLVQTVDVFTPCVDDPHLFGRICAANCLSDIYATGGTPRNALSIVGFPSETLPGEIMVQMMSGAMQVLNEAGVALIGGHSIKEDEIKLGFAVTGTIDPKEAEALNCPRAGHLLILTKPLGTGVLSFAHQVGRANPVGFAAAAQSMAVLNRAAAEAMKAAGASACTDITGFGLFGHLLRLVRSANLSAAVSAESLPAYPGALEAFRQGIIPGAVERNREFASAFVEVETGTDEAQVNLGYDAQTSGGLLIAIEPARLNELLEELRKRDVTGCVIGELRTSASKPIILTKTLPQSRAGEPTGAANCCCAAPAPAAVSSVPPTVPQAFGTFMRHVQAGGTVDARTKELIIFSLVVLSKCSPCFTTHYRKARSMGISSEELTEAAWCAIAMGGAPVKVFYDECMDKVETPQGQKCC